jgi:hypothetical protein
LKSFNPIILLELKLPVLIFNASVQLVELQRLWDVLLDGRTKRLQPKTSWQKLVGAPVQALVVDPDYYVGVSKSRE